MSDVDVMQPTTGAAAYEGTSTYTAAPTRIEDERYSMPTDHDLGITERRPVEHHRANELGQLLRGMAAGVILAALVALGIDNRQEIAVGYVFGDGNAHLWVLLAVAAVGGMLFGWLVAFGSRRK